MYAHVAIAPPSTQVVAIAGQVALDRHGLLIGNGDHAAQSNQPSATLRSALTAAGAGPAPSAKIT